MNVYYGNTEGNSVVLLITKLLHINNINNRLREEKCREAQAVINGLQLQERSEISVLACHTTSVGITAGVL